MISYYDKHYKPINEKPLKTFHNGYSGEAAKRSFICATPILQRFIQMYILHQNLD